MFPVQNVNRVKFTRSSRLKSVLCFYMICNNVALGGIIICQTLCITLCLLQVLSSMIHYSDDHSSMLCARLKACRDRGTDLSIQSTAIQSESNVTFRQSRSFISLYLLTRMFNVPHWCFHPRRSQSRESSSLLRHVLILIFDISSIYLMNLEGINNLT